MSMKKLRSLTLGILCLAAISATAQIDIKDASATFDYVKIDSINKALNYKDGDKITVYCIFSINSKGEIIDIKVRGPHPIYEQEAIKLLKSVPPIDSSKLKKENPTFSYPISFIVESPEKRAKRLAKEEKKQRRKNKK